MRIVVNRFVSDSTATISQLFINDKFICFGLEDAYHEKKVYGKTRIPKGLYQVGVHSFGKLHERYKSKFSSFHQGMLQIKDVPGFEGILIHCGNTDKDTEGCLLVGEGAISVSGNMSISGSVAAYSKLYPMVINAAIMGRLDILFQDLDLIKT